jgi:hypothetical protein
VSTSLFRSDKQHQTCLALYRRPLRVTAAYRLICARRYGPIRPQSDQCQPLLVVPPDRAADLDDLERFDAHEVPSHRALWRAICHVENHIAHEPLETRFPRTAFTRAPLP